MKLLFTLLLMVVSFSVYALDKDAVEQWKSDIDHYAKILAERHIDAFHSISESEFQQRLDALKGSLDSKTREQVLVELMEITRAINDGHTSVPLWNQTLNKFPLSFKVINDKPYVIGATEEHLDLLGAEIASVENYSADKVLNELAAIVPFSENPYSKKANAGYYLNRAEVLAGLGLIATPSNAEFTFSKDGRKFSTDLKSSDSYQLAHTISFRNTNGIMPVEKVNDNVWFGSTHEGDTVYFKYRRYPSMSEMESLAEDLLEYINENQSRHLIIDLRENYGGDFFIGLKLAQYLVLADSIDWKSGVYVLIDNETFSAAMSNAAQYTQILNATLVGEPTGAKPSGYQDMGQFTLPNSNLLITYSKRLYHFKEEGKNALYPSKDIALTIGDYINQNDRPLKWVLDNIEKGKRYE
ncbi:S41 family peptidase [Kangiella sediminilitoris]|uniref:Peptidase S41 n=1 Tax=Kangiella sediminilitoris TaxID=1144748 RepID=A0A1B3B9M7_9GAMM|nr:S41 family peptidase [Kangiella sediminilitoris]AOE49499.1 Peptidase S41 [Kangiella sediminilitoris]